jgi:hypothetical protein
LHHSVEERRHERLRRGERRRISLEDGRNRVAEASALPTRESPLTALGNHDIRRLQIPMNDVLPVSLIERVGHFDGIPQRQIQREPSFGQPVGESFPLQVLQDQEVDVLVPSQVVEGANVGMVEARHRPCLSLEALAPLRL